MPGIFLPNDFIKVMSKTHSKMCTSIGFRILPLQITKPFLFVSFDKSNKYITIPMCLIYVCTWRFPGERTTEIYLSLAPYERYFDSLAILRLVRRDLETEDLSLKQFTYSWQVICWWHNEECGLLWFLFPSLQSLCSFRQRTLVHILPNMMNRRHLEVVVLT